MGEGWLVMKGEVCVYVFEVCVWGDRCGRM